ncbi:MAG TPA: nicotinate phosphoribosyltransferase [Candidatus Sulfotelmatobacter sp.]|nr:nicotinate phosphoribosyltransferase [Candidatus Sulfotelmatobacter sp.]
MSESPLHSALLTDLYELTMAAAYFENKFTQKASFELFVRSLPKERGYLIAAGLEQALEYLENLRFRSEDIAYLRSQPVFQNVSPAFFEYLKDFRFKGDVWAVPEGTPVFGEEPLLRVTAPMIEAQVVETFLISTLTFQTMIASKATRVTSVAQGRPVVEFGSRRAHGPAAGALAARAAFIGGCSGTSNLEAGRRYGIPVFGTLAHSFVMAYGDEDDAFRRFEQLFPKHSVLLVDTYDTLAAIEKIVRSGLRPSAVRIDSGDLLEVSKQVRGRLNQGGLSGTQIFASGDLDEFAIADLLAQSAPIDAFGVGTALATSKDAPALSGVYKLVDLESDSGVSYRAKFSEEKTTYPGRKQVFRFSNSDGAFREDIIACESEKFDDGEPLLSKVMEAGTRTGPPTDLREIQKRAATEMKKMPAEYTRLRGFEKYPVTFSRHLRALLRAVHKEMVARS